MEIVIFLSLTKGRTHPRRGEVYGIYPTSPTIPTPTYNPRRVNRGYPFSSFFSSLKNRQSAP